MRIAAAVLMIVGLMSGSAAAQGNGRNGRAQGIPPGHMPPAGQCRVWYDGRPPGHQPRATSCREAERIAARDRNARVIYGSNRNTTRDRRDDRRADDRRADDRRADDRDRFPRNTSTFPRTTQERARLGGVPFNNGYEDGLDKGREDARDNDSYDPTRHRQYRSGDRGYDERYGTKDQYRNAYREGFRSGYEEAYRNGNGQRRETTAVRRWPF